MVVWTVILITYTMALSALLDVERLAGNSISYLSDLQRLLAALG